MRVVNNNITGATLTLFMPLTVVRHHAACQLTDRRDDAGGSIDKSILHYELLVPESGGRFGKPEAPKNLVFRVTGNFKLLD